MLVSQLAEVLAEVERDELREAALEAPEELMQEIARAHELGRLIATGSLVESLALHLGLRDYLRSPVFDGETFRFQSLKPPGLDGPDRLWRLLAVTAPLDCGTVSSEVLKEFRPPKGAGT